MVVVESGRDVVSDELGGVPGELAVGWGRFGANPGCDVAVNELGGPR